ncbi:uncharacterized protein LOC106655392 [Trichogramma pretiosum]|uniref:uncharacterized protein LOC106655392 n=1 Tax=Trichogramma pretiosum TaxID=7493 RepID=UPI0006C9CEEF|nr:uncharacterized protein LOC106655392 [Trichogramma pretiosum]
MEDEPMNNEENGEENAARRFQPVISDDVSGVSCIRGTLDLSSALLRENFYSGQQAIGGAVAGAAYAQLKHAYEWDAGDMDDLVITANWIYNATVHRLMTLEGSLKVNPLTHRVEPPIGLGDVEKGFVVGRTDFTVNFEYNNRGLVDRHSDEPNHTQLVFAFAEFFNSCAKRKPYGVIECQGDYLAIWKHSNCNSIFIFDAFPSRANPLPALYRIKTGAGLMQFFKFLKDWKADDEYFLYNLVIESHGLYVPRNDDAPDDKDDKDDDAMDTDDAACRPPSPAPRLARHFEQCANQDPGQISVNQMDCDDDVD